MNVQLKPTLCKRRRESVEMLAKCIALGRSLSSALCKDRAAAREVRVCVEMWIARVHPPLPSPPRWLHHVTAEHFSSPTLIFLSPAASRMVTRYSHVVTDNCAGRTAVYVAGAYLRVEWQVGGSEVLLRRARGAMGAERRQGSDRNEVE